MAGLLFFASKASLVRAIPPAKSLSVLTWIIIFSIRHIELVIDSLPAALFGLPAIAADALVRIHLSSQFEVRFAESGPYALMTTLPCVYCISMPTSDASLFETNEKRLLAIVLGPCWYWLKIERSLRLFPRSKLPTKACQEIGLAAKLLCILR
jgi:hypothetical protein